VVSILVVAINLVVQMITLLVIVQVFLSYFLSPYHPLRQNLDRIVEPMLRPIRRIVPPAGMLDFSALIFLVLLQLSGKIMIALLSGIH